MIRQFTEWMIGTLSRDGQRTFFDCADFDWVHEVEAGTPAIRTELEALLVHRNRIPNFQDISADQKVLTEGEEWKTFFFFAYGHKAEENCARCPETTRLLNRIPRMKTAMFSILAPRKHIPEHRGPHKGVLRYHLGLIIPQPSTLCRLRVRDDVRHWEEGKSLIFDDSHPHEVWNDSDRQRVVLFVDFERPLFFPLSWLNRLMIWRISRTPFITEAITAVRAAAGAAAGAERRDFRVGSGPAR